MLIPAEKVSTSTLASAPTGHLLLAVAHSQNTIIWLIGEGDKKTALLLEGDYGGHAFHAATNTNWSGIVIGPVQVRVDPASCNIGEGSTIWHLKAEKGSLLAPATVKNSGFDDRVWLPISEIPTLDGHGLYFSRWSIGMQGHDGDDWRELVKFDNGKFESELFKGDN